MNMISKMLAAEKRQKLIKESGVDIEKANLHPVYFSNKEIINIDKEMEVLNWCSSTIWGYLNFAGLMIPWHESDEKDMIVRFQRKNLVDLIRAVDEIDISLRAYGILICIASDFIKFERPALLFKQLMLIPRIKDLRSYARSREMVDRVANFMLEFLQMQVEYSGNARINEKEITGTANNRKIFISYRDAADRINYYDKLGVDYREWMRQNFEAFKEWKPNERLSLRGLLNKNNLDPTDNELVNFTSDPWMPIRRFLELSDECQFPDGFIPKGWQPAVDDFDNIKKVAFIKGDGFYYYNDGTQRRGKRHHARNKYLIIKVDPNNFLEFKEIWNDKKYIMKNPKWEEYRDYGMFPDMWNSKGENIHTAVSPLKWG